MNQAHRALIILTSHSQLGDTGKPTGFYWEELATPYWALRDRGISVDLASITGGEPPADPNSATDDDMNDDVKRFMDDDKAMESLKNTSSIDSVDSQAYDLIYLPGGHGTMWDFSQTPEVGHVVAAAYENNAVIGAVCHGVAGLTNALLPSGEPLITKRQINGFTDAEEEAAQLSKVVPYSLESALKERGCKFDSGENFKEFAIKDGRLVTGQNPASSAKVATLMIQALHETNQISD